VWFKMIAIQLLGVIERTIIGYNRGISNSARSLSISVCARNCFDITELALSYRQGKSSARLADPWAFWWLLLAKGFGLGNRIPSVAGPPGGIAMTRASQLSQISLIRLQGITAITLSSPSSTLLLDRSAC
jgi:hypothetical protein